MQQGILIVFLVLAFRLLSLAAAAYVVFLIIRALRKYIRTPPMGEEQRRQAVSLGQCLREQRARCGMTQEFVANALGVSRQAVSKWENGASDPSTTNLLALAKLYGVSAGELLRQCGGEGT